MSDYRLNTKCVQAGYTPGNGEPRQIPIYQSTTFKYAIWKQADISIPDFRTQPTITLRQKLPSWKAVPLPC